MIVTRRGVLSLALLATAVVASADITFENINATVSFDGGEEHNLDVDINGFEIDFTGGDVPIYIDNVNVDFDQAVVTIEYDARSDDPITALELIFSGWTMGGGSITFSEVVQDDNGNEVASVGGTIDGDDPFVQTDFLEFEGGGLTNYHVTKSFVLDIDNEANGPSLAALGLVEQNAVPEPATMGALAVGALGLLARRRRK